MQKKATPTNLDASILPSIDDVLSHEAVVALVAEFGRERILAFARAVIGSKRAELLSGELAPPDKESLYSDVICELGEIGAAERMNGVRRVINATGVVIHTNLGRAPLSQRAIEAINDAAGYSTIEYDLRAGSRGVRGAGLVNLIKLLTGAEDALAVNNCAAAALFVLSVFAAGREVIVSRGELVEIGGDFRIPDILNRSGAILREVGTTNRTHIKDYENAVCERTAMILKVHPSNFRIKGFTKTPTTAELSSLARKHKLIFFEDAGSGALVDLEPAGLSGEPVIGDVISSGADLVGFSGDKLLGGPQSGLIAGRRDLVERLRRDPFYRALRLDKIITVALEATLEQYARGDVKESIPALRSLLVNREEITERARRFVEKLERAAVRLRVSLVDGRSAVGGGAGPDVPLETTLIALTHPDLSDIEIEQHLRKAPIPIISRIENGQVLIDLRTVARKDESEILDALTKLQ